MCRESSYKLPLRIMARSMAEQARQVRQNAEQCQAFVPDGGGELSAALKAAERTAALLQEQLEEIAGGLHANEGMGHSPQPMITFIKSMNTMPIA